MYSLIEDLSTLTTIPVAALLKLNNKINYCICEDVVDSQLKGENLTQVDIGIGELQIYVEGEDLKYRFIPSKDLDTGVKTSILEKKSPLMERAEDLLVKRVIKTYKDFI